MYKSITAFAFLAGTAAAQSLGPLRILYQNDLTNDNTTAAILIKRPVPFSEAASQCAELNESLLSEITPDLQDQLRYLVYINESTDSTQYWYQSPSGQQRRSVLFGRQNSGVCDTFSLNGEGSTDCSDSLAVLCTNSPESYTSTSMNMAEGSNVTVSAGNLTVQGFRDARTFRFLGLPFAAPPVGDLRFQPAQPYTGSTELDATAYSPSCIQSSSSEVSEDCLTLNVYTPYLPGGNSTELLPVAFWIYGGAFRSGSNSLPTYDGGNIASRGDVVSVVVNYRLGALGNLASATRWNGNQGITDQIQALKWVQEYISALGGDPSRVTIYGESAGGQSVMALLSSSAATGLFAAAIQQSGPMGIPWHSRKVYTDYVTPAVAGTLGCENLLDESAVVDCLMNITNATSFASNDVSGAVNAAAAVALGFYTNATAVTAAVEPILPMVDVNSGVIVGQFVELLNSGSLPINNIPVMMGNVQDESTLFVAAAIPPGLPATQDVLNIVIGQALPTASADLVIANPDLFPVNTTNPNGTVYEAARIATLYTWQCPLQEILSAASQQNTFSQLYAYRMDQGVIQFPGAPAACTPNNPAGIDSVCHSEDIVEVFGNSAVTDIQYSPNNPLAYNQLVIDTWVSFIRTYNPNPSRDYLMARGRSYQATMQTLSNVTYDAYSNSMAPMFQLDNAPMNIEIPVQQECALLKQAGFLYDNINATFVEQA